MSQVKNLRAMFENKGDDGSPPDRGRSPGPSGSTTPGASFTGSPRPLSRIRSSFVAIEKDGRMGLQRTTSDESSLPRRRMSGDTDAESISAMSDNRSVTTAGDESAKPARRTFINDPIPESPRLPNDFDGSSHEIGAVTDQPSVNPDKQIDEEQPAKGLLPADPATATPKSDQATGAIANGKPKSSTAAPKQSTTTTSAAKKVTNRPNAISTKPNVKATASAKSPAMVKTPTSATSTNASKPSARPLARTAPKKDGAAPTTRPAASTVTKSTASSALKKPASLKSSSSGTGFVKPKVKSPTKPVSLPPSLMAQTASSGAKGNASRPSLSAQTGNAQARASSRASAASGSSKFPKAPVSKNSRPSIGPPPKKNTQERPVTRESNVNEDFLARMMRPTAASAQKTAEKAQLTPPKRTAGRPSTTSSRRESSVRSSSRAKTPSVHASEPADEHKHQTSAIDEIAIETAIAESVEEAAEVAHEADLTPPPKELPAPGPAQEAAAVAPVPVVNDDSPAEPESNTETEAVIAEQPVTTDDPVLETIEVQDSEEVADKTDEAGQEQNLVEAEPEVENALSASTPDEADAIEDAAVEAATVETADEETAIAKEVDLLETKAESQPAAHVISEEDQVAVEAATVETAEDVTFIAEKADLVQAPAEPVAIGDIESVNETEKIEPEAAVVDTKHAVEGSSDDTDIDLLAEKLAETRIAAGEDKSADEVAKESR